MSKMKAVKSGKAQYYTKACVIRNSPEELMQALSPDKGGMPGTFDTKAADAKSGIGIYTAIKKGKGN